MSAVSDIDLLGSERARRARTDVLHRIGESLARAATPADVGRAIVDEARIALGARTAAIWLRDGDHLSLFADVGYTPTMRAAFERVPIDSPLPIAEATRRAEPLWFQSRAEYKQQYPDEERATRGHNAARDLAFVCMPLVVEAAAIGVFTLVFDVDRVFDDDDRHFVWMVGRQCAHAFARARSIERLRREEHRFRTLVVASSQIVFTSDALGRPCEPSPSWSAFTGQTTEQWLALEGFDAIHPDDRGRVEEAWETAVRTRRFFDTEYRLRRHDGAWVPVVARATPVVSSDGELREWIGTITDVSPRKRAQERLARMQRVTADLSREATWVDIVRVFLGHLVEAFGASSGALALRDGDALDVLAQQAIDPRFHRGVGRIRLADPYPICQVIRDRALLVLPTREACAAAFPDLVATAPDAFGALVATPLEAHGEVIGGLYLRFTKERALDPEERDHFLALAAQCTQALERARLYEAERRKNEHLRILAEASELLSSSLDYGETLKNVVRLVVPAAADFAFFDVVEPDGQVRRTALARDPDKQAILDASQWSKSERTDVNLCALSSGEVGLHPVIDDAFLRDMAVNEGHLAVLRRLELCAMLTVPFVTRGKLTGALTLCMGESGRRYDATDATMVQDLARRAAMAVDNARLFGESREAVRVREEFLSIASHELNTPLTALKMQLFGLRRVASLPEPASSRLVVVERQVDRLGKLVMQLLDVSRLTAGRMILEHERFDLAPLVREVVDRFDLELARSGSRADVDVESAVGDWDRLRLDQVVTNLVANAVKYGRGRPIEVRLRAEGGLAILTVRDEGIGISASHIGRVFDRFERAVSRNYGGLGLGLWIARQIVEASGGRVLVESAVDVGSTFRVELPLARD